MQFPPARAVGSGTRGRLMHDTRSGRRAACWPARAAPWPDVARRRPVVLLASELCENAVLHAGTAFEFDLRMRRDEVIVAVTDRGPGSLEQHLAEPRQRYGRAATHGRGLLPDRAAGDDMGHPARARRPARPVLGSPSPADPARRRAGRRRRRARRDPTRSWSAAAVERVRWLLHVPPALAGRLDPDELVRELRPGCATCSTPRPCVVEVDPGDGSGRARARPRRCPPPDGAVAPRSRATVSAAHHARCTAASGSSRAGAATPPGRRGPHRADRRTGSRSPPSRSGSARWTSAAGRG